MGGGVKCEGAGERVVGLGRGLQCARVVCGAGLLSSYPFIPNFFSPFLFLITYLSNPYLYTCIPMHLYTLMGSTRG